MALIAQNTFTVHRKPDDGLTPVIYSLDISDKLVSKSNAGVLTPSSVSARAVLQVGDRREVIGVDEKIDYKGRNLVLNSQRNYTSSGYSIAILTLSEKLIEGESYALSFKGNVNSPNTIGIWRSYGNTLISMSIPNDGNGNYSMVFVCPKKHSSDTSGNTISFYNYPSQTALSATISNIKLEKGTAVMPYAPAPEDAQIKLFTGNGQTEMAYASGSNYAIKSTDKLLKWQLLLNDQLQASDSTTIVADGHKGDKGDQGLSGALLRPLGEWSPNTQYVNNTQYRDTVIYNKNKWIVKNTHCAGSTFDPAQWEDFNEFINVATQVLLADKAWIDILGAQGIAVGTDAANRWELTNGRIRHTATGLELTATGKIIAPPGGITFSSGKTVEETIKDQIDTVQIGGRNLLLISKYVNIPSSNEAFNFRALSVSRDIQLGLFNFSADVISTTGVISFSLLFFDDTFTKYGGSGSATIVNGIATGTIICESIPYSTKFLIYSGASGSTQGKSLELKNIKLERGDKPTDWSPAPEDMDYLTEAIQGDTVLNGGLVMSNVMAVRNGKDNTEASIVAGMSGLKDDGVYFFADLKNAYRKAVNYFKGLSTERPLFAVSKSGFMVAMSGLIGCFHIAKDLITIKDASGVDKVKFTGKSVEDFASQAGSSSGGVLGSNWSESVSTGDQKYAKISQLMLSHSYVNKQKSVYSVKIKSNLSLSTSVRPDKLDGRAIAYAQVNVDMRYVVKLNSNVVLERTVTSVFHDCYTDNMNYEGVGNEDESGSLVLDQLFSEEFGAGTISVEVYADIDYNLVSSRGSDGYSSSATSSLVNNSGVIELISTEDETIFASDGLSIRLTAKKLFKLFKKDSELNLIYKGNVSPDSNIPHLICGGEVNQWGNSVNKLGEDSSPFRTSTGHYRVTLPLYMQGKSNYVVQLTGVNTDNVVTRGGIDTAANCFYVQTWQSPGSFEDASFTYMVYRAR